MKIKLNENFRRVKQSYLFSEVGRRVRSYCDGHPDAKIIRLGIGDVTLPLSPTVISAIEAATVEMGERETFRGYAPEYGYEFLREAISRHYAESGVTVPPASVFVSDGAKSDIGNLVDLFGDTPVLIPNPVYPAYLDSNLLSGRTVEYIEGNAGNRFLPMPDALDETPRLIYLCSPNNPTGAVYSREQLTGWVDYANRTGSLILFDSAYEAFISGDEPRSIFAVPGAETCALEICSLSKTAGFTGTRCAWTVIPEGLTSGDLSLRAMWERRQATKFNGVPYIVQRAAEAALSPLGMAESRANIRYYMKNARALAELLTRKGIFFVGGESSPYLWLRCPDGMDSWSFFDYLLSRAGVVGTPGEGFGTAGEGYFRLTAFGTHEATREAVRRLEDIL